MKFSQNEIARRTGFSRSTVSRVLSNHPAISPATRQKVRKAADELGYKKNALVSMLTSQLRASKTQPVQQTIAFIGSQSEENLEEQPLSVTGLYYEGVKKRADELGYRVDFINRFENGMTGKKLQRILRSRGIRGLLIAPRKTFLGHLTLNWNHFAAVSIVNPLPSLLIHYASPFSFNNLGIALRMLSKYRYRRIGLAVSNRTDRYANLAYSARYSIFNQSMPEQERVPPFMAFGQAHPRHDVCNFEQWFCVHRPEVIIHAGTTIPYCMEAIGIQAPADVATCDLMVSDDGVKRAGINQMEEAVGMTAVDLLVEQLHNHSLGIPKYHKAVHVEGKWVDGPNCPRRQSRGFTVTELLVVIGVIAILSMISLPVVQGFGQQSRNATCVSNLKAMGGAHGAYIADHGGALIPGSERNANPDGGRSLLWYHVLQSYLGDPRILAKDSVILNPERPKWQLCPAKERSHPLDYREIGYGWNHEFFGLYGTLPATGSNSGAGAHMAQITHPSETVIIGDSQDTPGAPLWNHFRLYGRDKNLSNCARRHGGKGNYLMLDGHVQALTPEELTANSNYLYKKVKR